MARAGRPALLLLAAAVAVVAVLLGSGGALAGDYVCNSDLRGSLTTLFIKHGKWDEAVDSAALCSLCEKVARTTLAFANEATTSANWAPYVRDNACRFVERHRVSDCEKLTDRIIDQASFFDSPAATLQPAELATTTDLTVALEDRAYGFCQSVRCCARAHSVQLAEGAAGSSLAGAKRRPPAILPTVGARPGEKQGAGGPGAADRLKRQNTATAPQEGHMTVANGTKLSEEALAAFKANGGAQPVPGILANVPYAERYERMGEDQAALEKDKDSVEQTRMALEMERDRLAKYDAQLKAHDADLAKREGELREAQQRLAQQAKDVAELQRQVNAHKLEVSKELAKERVDWEKKKVEDTKKLEHDRLTMCPPAQPTPPAVVKQAEATRKEVEEEEKKLEAEQKKEVDEDRRIEQEEEKIAREGLSPVQQQELARQNQTANLTNIAAQGPPPATTVAAAPAPTPAPGAGRSEVPPPQQQQASGQSAGAPVAQTAGAAPAPAAGSTSTSPSLAQTTSTASPSPPQQQQSLQPA